MTDVKHEPIPVHRPMLVGNEEQYLIECIRSGWISSEGPFVSRFEKAFASTVNRDSAVAVSSGTAGLEVAIASLGIEPGDEVIVPTLTIISCAIAIVRSGGVPVFVDCDPLTWNMRVEDVRARITEKTKAIMVVHLYGLPADIEPILDLAKDRGLSVLEDASQAHGQTYKGQPCGSFGDISVFSLYANKQITAGEGGIIATNNSTLDANCRSLRSLSHSSERRFLHSRMGWSCRMSSLQAAVALAGLESMDKVVARQQSFGKTFTEAFADIPWMQLPVAQTDYADNKYWTYGVVVREGFGITAKSAVKQLEAQAIGTRPFFYPLHMQPLLQKLKRPEGECCNIAESLVHSTFCLPSGPGLEDYEVDRIIGAVKSIRP